LEKINWTPDGWPVFANDATHNRDVASVDYTDNFETLNPVWRWRVNLPAAYRVGSDGLFLTASQANDGIGALLVQPITSIAYDVSATVVTKTTSERAGASVTMVGGANNRFGAPIAGIGIGVFGTKVKVWRIAKDDIQSLEELDIAGAEETVTVKMAVTDGHTVDFFWKEGGSGEWKTALENYDAAPLVPWGMGFRVGIAAQGQGGEQLHITGLEIKNR